MNHFGNQLLNCTIFVAIIQLVFFWSVSAICEVLWRENWVAGGRRAASNSCRYVSDVFISTPVFMNNAYVNSICAVTINSLMLVGLKEQASLMLSRFFCRDISGCRCWPRWHCWEKQSQQGELCLLVVLRSSLLGKFVFGLLLQFWRWWNTKGDI